ncbi:MAG TPA: hypothetical protein VL337_07325 [Acidimicrobiales bacterium]|nr:hypothetical protein [Acidimicrobiales bacterium]
MAKDLERWTERTPDRAPTFGLAREAELLPLPVPVPAPEPTEDADALPAPSEPEHGPFLAHLLLPWSYGDHDTLADKWRRLRCRRGRHEMIGGQTMQVGGSVTFLERRCRWCEAAPGA